MDVRFQVTLPQEKNPDGLTWIGATDQAKEGYWQWTDCSSWNFAAWAVDPSTLPPDFNKVENCAAVHSKNRKDGASGWDHYSCDNSFTLRFVCGTPICSGEETVKTGRRCS